MLCQFCKLFFCSAYSVLLSYAIILLILLGVVFSLETTIKAQNLPLSTTANTLLRGVALDTKFAGVLSQTRNSPGASHAYPLPDGKILVAGGFKVVNGVIKLNLARLFNDGTLDNSFGITLESTSQITPATIINRVLVQPDGKILIGGFFNSVNNVAINNLARLNEDGTLDTTFDTGSGFSGSVTAIALQPDGKILVGGDFFNFNGVDRVRLARLNADGSLDLSFNSTISSFWMNTMNSILPLPDGKIFIQGRFHSVDSVQRRGLAKLNSNGSLDASFVEPESYSMFNGMNTFAVRPDGKIYIGGPFEIRVNNQLACKNLCRLNPNGTFDASYTSSFGTNNGVRLLYLQPDERLLIYGDLQNSNGTSRNGLARLNENGSPDSSFNPNFHVGSQAYQNNGNLNAIIPVADGSYLLPGEFNSINGTPIENLARIDSNGNLDASFAPHFAALSFYSRASAIQPDGKILVSGDFNRANGLLRGRIARFNPDGTLDTSFNTTISNHFPGTLGAEDVDKIVVQPDGKILIGGTFTRVNGEAHLFLARLNQDGSVESNFNPILTYEGSGGGSVNSIAVQPDGKIIIGGAFQTVNGTPLRGYARLNADGSLDSSFVIPFDENYFAGVSVILLQPNGKVLIGGDFRFTGNSNTYSVAQLNADGSLDTSFIVPTEKSSTPYLVKSMARQPDGKILVGGTGNSSNRPLLTRLNANGSVDSSFYPGRMSLGFSYDRIYSIIVQPNGKILIAGSFSRINDNVRFNIARLVENGGLDFSFNLPQPRVENTSMPPTVFSLNQTADGNLIAAGYFDRIGNNFVSGFARLQVSDITSQPLFDFDGDGRTDYSIFRSSAGEWWYLRSGDEGNRAFQFGNSTDRIVPADYTGDGKTDAAFFRPSTGEWFILRSEDGSFYSAPFGTTGDIPVPADFDGDGRTDLAVFRPSEANWYINRSSGGFSILQFGTNGDVPVPADFDGDGKADLAIYRPSKGEWWLLRSSDGGNRAFQFGNSQDKPVPADYTGDGKTDVAFYRPSTSEWFVLRSENSSFYSAPFGAQGDVPVAGDYDGDGKADIAVWRPTDSNWYVVKSSGGFSIAPFGSAGDKPVPSSFIP